MTWKPRASRPREGPLEVRLAVAEVRAQSEEDAGAAHGIRLGRLPKSAARRQSAPAPLDSASAAASILNGGSFNRHGRATRSDDKRRADPAGGGQGLRAQGLLRRAVSEIARQAGVADGTIYLYFRNKEDILVSLFDEVMAEHIERARRELARWPGRRARACAPSPTTTCACSASNRDLAVVFQVELRQSTKFMERFTASWLQDYFALLTERDRARASARAACAPTCPARWPPRPSSAPSTRWSRRGSSAARTMIWRSWRRPSWTSSCAAPLPRESPRGARPALAAVASARGGR